MKPYLLIAGDNYYPDAYTGDWIGTFATREEAESAVRAEKQTSLFLRGPLKGQVKKEWEEYRVNHPSYGDQRVDWYEIIDLRKWMSESEE